MTASNPHQSPVEDAIPVPHVHGPYAAFSCAEFRWYLLGNLLFLFGSQMQTAVIFWEIYERTNSKLYLGLVGLAQVIPVVLLSLPAGQLIDRMDRRRVIMGSLTLIFLSSLGLAVISFWQADVRGMFVCLTLNGIARAFQQPAKSSLVPQLVPREIFPSAVTWSTSSFQLATVIGPGLGGVLLGVIGAAHWIYLIDATAAILFIVALKCIPPKPPAATSEKIGWQSLGAGLTYLWRSKLLFGAITLDMFAFMFGGATALLPVFAKDILHTGPDGLGKLQAAAGLGALAMSFLLAHLPPIRRAGWTLLLVVAGFGIATVVFGFARNFWLAWAMLFLTGALDMVSVIIRHTLVQLWTPDAMRGRVSAVNGMFISVSNELGAFESGLVAHLFQRAADPTFGPTVSVASGGFGTLAVVVAIALLFPELRRHGRINETPHK